MKNLKMKLKQQKKKIELFINAIYAGIMIGIGGTVYLSVANKMLGAFLFGIGL
jgi:formate/nitrite transporter FocA (FNT family)